MDERLEKAMVFSNYRIAIENRKIAIKRRYETMSVLHYKNGMFKASPLLLSFVDALINNGDKTAIIIDEKEQPVEILDLTDFKSQLFNTYYQAINEYSTEMAKMKKARSVKKAMDW